MSPAANKHVSITSTSEGVVAPFHWALRAGDGMCAGQSERSVRLRISRPVGRPAVEKGRGKPGVAAMEALQAGPRGGALAAGAGALERGAVSLPLGGEANGSEPSCSWERGALPWPDGAAWFYR